jgi:hypothetical protein
MKAYQKIGMREHVLLKTKEIKKIKTGQSQTVSGKPWFTWRGITFLAFLVYGHMFSSLYIS